MPIRRYFISYRRRAERDSALASYLHQFLLAAGHEVFIDTEMVVGCDWSREIERRIAWCDFLVVLLSQEAVESEMVQEEVRLAHHRRRLDGAPQILPVRVAYEGPLGYALGAYMERLQYLLWRDESDSQRVATKLLHADGEGDASTMPQRLVEPPTGPDEGQVAPLTSADPRPLRQPGGALRIDDGSYIRRAADDIVDGMAADEGHTLVIKAPRQMGKTSLLIRHLAAAQQAGKATVLIDMQVFTAAELESLPRVLQLIGSLLLRDLNRPSLPLGTNLGCSDFTQFIEDAVFNGRRQAIVLAFDEVDRLISRDYRDTFFGMLRHWHNRRALWPAQGWERLDLVLCVATEPSVLIEDSMQSPFNVADPVQLKPFDRRHLDQLNAVHGNRMPAALLDRLFELLGGHPYLSRLAIYRLLGPRPWSPDRLFSESIHDDGPFAEHLRAKLSVLQRAPDLSDALARLLGRGVQPAERTYYRLQAMGLLRRDEHRRAVPANQLYGLFFSQVL